MLPPTVNWTAAGEPPSVESTRPREPWRPAAVAAVSEPKVSVPRSAVARSSVLDARAEAWPRVKVPAETRVVPV